MATCTETVQNALQGCRDFYAHHIAPTVDRAAQAAKPALDWIVANGTLAGRRIHQIKENACDWVQSRCGETAGAVARKVADVLPELGAMLALFSGFTILPMALLAGRALFCLSDTFRALFNNDMPAAREHALQAVQKMSNRFMQGAVLTSLATAGFLGIGGLVTGSLPLIARGGVFLCLGLAGMNHLLPKPEARASLEDLSSSSPIPRPSTPPVPPADEHGERVATARVEGEQSDRQVTGDHVEETLHQPATGTTGTPELSTLQATTDRTSSLS